MKILFLCTAHNSLSQRLYLILSRTHTVSIEYALSDHHMIEAAALAKPDLIICPFLTTRVPCQIYDEYLTLIVHPGPPGDAGPSALDWALIGDDGSESDAPQLLRSLSLTPSRAGRSHWGVTVLQAVEEFDAGPVWAFEQFALDIDASGLTKSDLYRGPVTRAALTATLASLDRITAAAARCQTNLFTPPPSPGYEGQGLILPCSSTSASPSSPDPPLSSIFAPISPRLHAEPAYRFRCVTLQQTFLGGATHHRPLLKAAQRDFDIQHHTAIDISRRVRSADSQPGCLTKLFGVSLYVYGGTVEGAPDHLSKGKPEPGTILACRDDGALCVATCEGKGIWFTHIRRVKRKTDTTLWPKVPAAAGLQDLGLLDAATLARVRVPHATVDFSRSPTSTHQDVWVDFACFPGARRVAFVNFAFYNGAMSTAQCGRLLEALHFAMSTHVLERPLAAVVLMGGPSYFSNGIALNVIEASPDPAAESWRNINRIDDVVHFLLDDLPRRGILTIAALRGNCAAGGVALAAACDVVVAGDETVLNPAYRALGLHGSEFHSLSYPGRCGGSDVAQRLLRDMVPLSASDAEKIGLVDHILPGSGAEMNPQVEDFVKRTLCDSAYVYQPGAWKANVDLSLFGLAAARTAELGEMAKDFWSARSVRYHARRRDFVRKIRPVSTPLRFATHRRGEGMLDEEESNDFDRVELFEQKLLEEMVEKKAKELLETWERVQEKEENDTRGDGGPFDEAHAPYSVTLGCEQFVTARVIEQDISKGVALERPPRDMRPLFSCYYQDP